MQVKKLELDMEKQTWFQIRKGVRQGYVLSPSLFNLYAEYIMRNPGLGRSPGGGKGNSLQYSYLGSSVDRGALWAIVHGVTKSWRQLSTGLEEAHTGIKIAGRHLNNLICR